MQVSSCHRERRKNKGKERKGDILALVSGGRGGEGEGGGGQLQGHVLGVFFNTVSTMSVHNMEVLTVFVVSTVLMHVQ
jgi:hypothetical protein